MLDDVTEYKNEYIGKQYASWFTSGRPKISWELAEFIYVLLKKHNITEVGVTGSLCPSILISLAYGAANSGCEWLLLQEPVG